MIPSTFLRNTATQFVEYRVANPTHRRRFRESQDTGPYPELSFVDKNASKYDL